MESLNHKLYGTEELPSAPRELSAGSLRVKLDGGNLRSIRYRGVEILRGVYFLVRDTSWGTYAPVLSEIEITEDAHAFYVRYLASCEGMEGLFDYRVCIIGDAQGSLSFSAVGRSPADFPANRIGFVVLHPIEAIAGAYIDVEHTDGAKQRLQMPRFISPDQPVFDIRALTHEAAPGLCVTVRMEGEAYEMEDQRNWTDASFKTYVRPLSKPRPFKLPANEMLSQSVTISIGGHAIGRRDRIDAARRGYSIEIGSRAGAMPQIALALDAADAEEAISYLPQLGQLAPQWLSLRCAEGADFAAAGRFAAGLGAKLLTEIIIAGIDPDIEIERQRHRLATAAIEPHAVIVCPARDMRSRPSGTLPDGEAAIESIIAAARRQFPRAMIGGGMLTYFTELNRNPPPPEMIDFVTHGSSAIVHAADDLSVMETIEAWPDILRSVRRLYGATPYWLCSTTLGMRENPYGSAPAANPMKRRVPMVRFDPRHRSLFGAAWSLGVFAAAAREGVVVTTLAHAAGDFGLLERTAKEVREAPAFRWLKAIGRGAGKPRRETAAQAGLATVAFENDEYIELWVANLTSQPINVTVGACRAELIERLDATQDADDHEASGGFGLGSYGLARLRLLD
jgi:D-apionolactonase